MRPGFAATVLLLALDACGSSHPAGPTGIAVDPARLDFGDLPVAQESTRTLRARAEGADVVPALHIAGPFRASVPARLPTTGADIAVTFAPVCSGPAEGLLVLECPGCGDVIVPLSGTGTGNPLVAPGFLDLGSVPVGGTRPGKVTVENRGCAAVPLAAEIAGDAGFSVTTVPASIAAGASADIELAFQADGDGHRNAVLHITSGAYSLDVHLMASGGGPSLHVDPASIDLPPWPVGVGTPPVRQLLVSSPASLTPVRVKDVSIVSGPFAATPDRFLPTDVVNHSLAVRISLTADADAAGTYQGVLRVRGVDPAQPDIDVPLGAVVTPTAPCRLDLRPPLVQFGLIQAGVVAVRELQVVNVGSDDCWTWNYSLFSDTGSPFFLLDAPAAPVDLAPGAVQSLHIEYGRVLGYFEEGAELSFGAVGSSLPETVDVTGQVGNPVPTLTPAVLDLGSVPVGGRSLGAFRLDGAGGLVTVSEVDVIGDRQMTSAAPPSMPFGLGPGYDEPLHILFEPQATGPVSAQIEVYIPPNSEPILATVIGTGIDPCPDCMAPTASCPGDASVKVGDLIDLRGAAAGPGAVACAYNLVSAPPGSTAQPDPPAGCFAWFRPDHVGDFTLRLTASSPGGTASCDTHLHASLRNGLMVEATWSDPDDVDLHLFHPLAGSPTDAAAWGAPRYDVNAGGANFAPAWDAIGSDDDPSLARSDGAGTGPEEITILHPAAHPYPVGVSWVSSSHGNAALDGMVRIFCDGVQVASAPVSMNAPGQGVYVGDAAWNGGHCTFTPLNLTVNLHP